MNNLVQVEVQIDSFKDKEMYNKPLKVTRRGEEINIIQKLLRKGDIYETTIERADYLESIGAVKKIEKNSFKRMSEEK